jgi:hypothetical protein
MIFTPMKNPSTAGPILPFQPTLSPALPTVLGNVDYRDFERQLRRLDQLLRASGLEKNFVEQCLVRYDAQVPAATLKARQRHPRYSYRAPARQRAARPAGRGLSRDEPAAGGVSALPLVLRAGGAGRRARARQKHLAGLCALAAAGNAASADPTTDPGRPATGGRFGVGTGQRHRTGNRVAGQHLRQNEHSLSRGLGVVG